MHKYGFDLVFIVYGTVEKTNAPKNVTIAGKEYINDFPALVQGLY
jgi:hypothetical protein